MLKQWWRYVPIVVRGSIGLQRFSGIWLYLSLFGLHMMHDLQGRGLPTTTTTARDILDKHSIQR